MSKARELAQKPNQPTGRKNLIINGAMNVAQRGTSVTAQTGGGIKTVDRFTTETSGAPYDHAQSSDAPVGFSNSIKATIDGAFTPTAAQYFIPFETRLERDDLAHLAYGTSGAKAVTLSFWIKSDTTGTYTVDFYNTVNTRRWSQSYTIDTADTWEQKTLTWTGDTAFDFGAGTAAGSIFYWWMTAGTNFTSGSLPSTWENTVNTNRAVGVPTSLADNAEFYLTGVQLEVGSVATEFEHRSYGEEFALCQRYYRVSKANAAYDYILAAGQFETSTACQVAYDFTGMRTAPTVTSSGGLAGEVAGGGLTLGGAGLAGSSFCRVGFNASSPTTSGKITNIRDSGGNNAVVNFDAEL